MSLEEVKLFADTVKQLMTVAAALAAALPKLHDEKMPGPGLIRGVKLLIVSCASGAIVLPFLIPLAGTPGEDMSPVGKIAALIQVTTLLSGLWVARPLDASKVPPRDSGREGNDVY
jgi:hypothetical protein